MQTPGALRTAAGAMSSDAQPSVTQNIATAEPSRPDLLRILTIFAVARLTIGITFMALASVSGALSATSLMPLMPLIPVFTSLLQLGVTRSKSLQRRLGARHLVLVLAIATIDVIGVIGLFTQWFFYAYVAPMREAAGLPAPILWLRSIGIEVADAPPVAPLLSLIGLFILLLIVSWRYPLRYALAYIATTSLVEFAGVLLIFRSPTLIFTQVTIIMARTLIFSILALVIAYLVEVQNRQQRALIDANAKLVRHLTIVEELTISRERNRLARELHDTLAHTLSAASVQLEATDSLWESDRARARNALGQALSTTRQGLSETRRALFALRAAPLDDLGIEFALKELAALAHQRGGAHVSTQIALNGRGLPAQIEQTLYRIAQEALDNVIRHANARHITLALVAESNMARLRVEDDGAGFDVAEALARSGHFGLKGLIERVESLGGRALIDSRPGAGTRILVEIAHDHSHIAV
jgi:signal transduction histidine kinase